MSKLEEAISTVRAWHRTALEMRDKALDGDLEAIEDIYIDAALRLPFYRVEADENKDRGTLSKEDFDAFHGTGLYRIIQGIINELAPTTRRDDWWATPAPYEIIATHLMKREAPASPLVIGR